MFEIYIKLLRYREILAVSTISELRMRYSGSVIGPAWAVVGPIILIAFYAVIYTVVFRIRPANLTVELYVLHVVSALVPFISFAQSLGAGASCLRANKAFMLSTVFPVELAPIRIILVVNVMLLAGIVVVSTISLFINPPSISLLALPLIVLLQIMFTIGIAWIFSIVGLIVKDLQFLIQYLVIMLLIVTPIAYTADMVPPALSAIIYFNPLYYFTSAYQSIIVYGSFPPVFNLTICIVMSVSVFIIGYNFFMRTKTIAFDYA